MFSAKALAASAAAVDSQLYVEDVFSTYLYTGTGAPQVINAGVELSSTTAWSTNKIYQGGVPLSDNDARAVTTDSSNNYYVTGRTWDGSRYCAFVVKYNSSGVLQWQRRLYNGTTSGESITVDTSGNVYVSGDINDGEWNAFVVKYNSSGTLQWQRTLLEQNAYGRGVATDSSGNVYVTGNSNVSGGGYYAFVVKYNSSGTLQWQRKLTESTTGTFTAAGIAVDPSGNICVSGTTYVSAAYRVFTAKYNSSGTLQWQRRLSYTELEACGIATDSSGNVYVTGIDSTDSTAYVAKYNSSGVLQWDIELYDAYESSAVTTRGIVVDSGGSVYVVGTIYYTMFVAKISSSGTPQWQRLIYEATTTGFVSGYGVAVSSNGNVYASGRLYDNAADAYYAVVVKLAADGSTTSGNALVNMSSRDAAFVTGYLTDAEGTASESASGLTSSTGTATDAAGTATSESFTQDAVTSDGGLVWIKGRNIADLNNVLVDTDRGVMEVLSSDRSNGQIYTGAALLTGFLANGFSLGSESSVNGVETTYASWTFRKAPKFFDVVTYTGTGANRTVSHSLGSVPGCIIVKRTDTTGDWQVYHRSLANTEYLVLNTTAAKATGATRWNSTTPTSTVFSLGTDATVNASGGTYVAYLFAHDAGGFGASGADNVISCGSFTTDGSRYGSVTLNYEPQWVLVKNVTSAASWQVMDNMRNYAAGTASGDQGESGTTKFLEPNSSNAEGGGTSGITATGFTWGAVDVAGDTYIYIAIRRGPMQTPTNASDVFSPVTYTGGPTNRMIQHGFPVDMWLVLDRTGSALSGYEWPLFTRLLSNGNAFFTTNNSAWGGTWGNNYLRLDNNVGVYLTTSTSYLNATSNDYVAYGFRRTQGFFDVVCYTSNGSSSQSIPHNLGVVPQLAICKSKNVSGDWEVAAVNPADPTYFYAGSSGARFRLNTTDFWGGSSYLVADHFDATAFRANAWWNSYNSGTEYVVYLFASCPGVSKVGSYTGNGSSLTINCGFTNGARFILIKRTDSAGDWYVYDSARGITTGGSTPQMKLNSTSSENTSYDPIDPDSTGFIVNNNSTYHPINVNTATYIYLAIA